MEAKEFVKGYPRAGQREQRQDNPTFDKAEEYSAYFGDLLHTVLSGDDAQLTEPDLESKLINYFLFIRDELLPYEQKLLEQAKPYGLRRFSRFSSHWSNSMLADEWMHLLNPSTASAQHRQRSIRGAQDLFAYEAVRFYAWKERKAQENNGYSYLSEEMRPLRNVIEGRLNEYDTAIALLDIVKKHPHLALVAGPSHFEQTAFGAGVGNNRNADFIFYDTTEQRAIGIQTKTSIGTHKEAEAYDPERIVLIDGRVDLQNHLNRRVDTRTSDTQTISWAGMIAAAHLKNMPVFGKNSSELPIVIDRRQVLKTQMDAKILLGKITVDRPAIAKIIGDRVLRTL